jgi:hypothetical protein
MDVSANGSSNPATTQTITANQADELAQLVDNCYSIPFLIS